MRHLDPISRTIDPTILAFTRSFRDLPPANRAAHIRMDADVVRPTDFLRQRWAELRRKKANPDDARGAARARAMARGMTMATKAELFRAAQERTRPRPSRARVRTPAPGLVVDTSQPGVNATFRRKGGPSTAARNRAAHAARKASFALEGSLAPAKATRKSTRKSANRIKPESNLERRQKRRAHSPQTRSERAQVRSPIRRQSR
jgi:hypothetical protein